MPTFLEAKKMKVYESVEKTVYEVLFYELYFTIYVNRLAFTKI